MFFVLFGCAVFKAKSYSTSEMFPVSVQKIVEAYAIDMSLLEQLKKLTYSDYIIQQADGKFSEYSLRALRPIPDPILSFQERLMCALSNNVNQAVAEFPKTAAGWVYRKIESMELKRVQMWSDIKMLS